MLVTKGIVTGKDDIAQEEISLQLTDLPAHYIHLESPLQTAPPEIFYLPLSSPQDPSAWDFQFLSPLGFDATLPLDLEWLDWSNNTQFSDDDIGEYGGCLIDSVSSTYNFCESGPIWLQYGFEDHLGQLGHFDVGSGLDYGHFGQAAFEWYHVGGYIQGVGVTSSIMKTINMTLLFRIM